jgi:tetratricopeptide (TPR) repeat protein
LSIGLARQVGNTNVSSPIRSGTIPPSSLQSGLIDSASPIDTRGNLIITGNVGGGKHFRGPMPYQSTTSFGASLGSSSLDSFLRYSAGLEESAAADGVRHMPRPFYSPTGTVTTTRPGLPGVWTPATTRITGRAISQPGIASTDEADLRAVLRNLELRISNLKFYRTQELERLISDEIGTSSPQAEISSHLRGEGLTAQQYQVQMEQLQRELKQISDQATRLGEASRSRAELRQTLTADNKPSLDTDQTELRTYTRTEPSQAVESDRRQVSGTAVPTSKEPTGYVPYERSRWIEGTDRASLQPAEQTRESLVEAGIGLPTWEQLTSAPQLPSDKVLVEQQLDTQKEAKWRPSSLSSRQATGIGDETEYEARTSQRSAASQSSIRGTIDKYKAPPDVFSGVSGPSATAKRDKGQSKQKLRVSGLLDEGQSGEADQIAAESSAYVSARAKTILADYESFAAYSKDKYDWYMRAAQVYLKQGKYYRAVDAYTLASIYKADDPLAYAGKSHALFAAGEYISSALFLARALEIMPEYAQVKVDLIAIVGDKDELDDRIADAEECLQLARRAMPTRERARQSALAGSDRPAAAELQFLLGYVYLQVDRLGAANSAIEAAHASLPDARAVAILKKAIDDACGNPEH